MIAFEGVSKRWTPTGPWVVRGLDLRVARGELLALIGSSGSGKTTALRLVNRLVVPTEGRVTLDAQDVGAGPPELLRRRIGYVIQSGGLFPHWTVARNIGVVPRLLGWPEERVRERVATLLALVGLAGFEERAPLSLSGGQRQRVGVARALAGEPPVLLMDEPFGALDPVTRDHLQDEVRALHDRLGLTTVIVTHDMSEALRLADRIAVLDGGRIVRLGTPRELLTDPGPPVVSAFLDAPRRHAALLAALS